MLKEFEELRKICNDIVKEEDVNKRWDMYKEFLRLSTRIEYRIINDKEEA